MSLPNHLVLDSYGGYVMRHAVQSLAVNYITDISWTMTMNTRHKKSRTFARESYSYATDCHLPSVCVEYCLVYKLRLKRILIVIIYYGRSTT